MCTTICTTAKAMITSAVICLLGSAPLSRHKAAVDQDQRAVAAPKRRQHPIAGAFLGDGLNQRLSVMQEAAGDGDVPVLVVRGGDRGP